MKPASPNADAVPPCGDPSRRARAKIRLVASEGAAPARNGASGPAHAGRSPGSLRPVESPRPPAGEGAAAGENLDAMLTSHIAGLRRYARALLGNSSDVDDLVQECLTRALERIRSWRKIRDVRAYLFAVLHNVHIDRLARQRRAGTAVPLDHAVAYLALAPAQPVRLEIRDLARALQQLPVEQRRVVLLVGLEGIPYQEVADLLGIPIGTVMSRLSRGREALRRLMAYGSGASLRIVKS